MEAGNVWPEHIAGILDDAIEVRLYHEEDFLKVKETLTRIGIASISENTLCQSCYILHKRGRYFIVSFKELFLLDGKASCTDFTEADKARRNAIANLVASWGLVELVEPAKSRDPVCKPNAFTVIPYRQKSYWKLVNKYEVGRRR